MQLLNQVGSSLKITKAYEMDVKMMQAYLVGNPLEVKIEYEYFFTPYGYPTLAGCPKSVC